MDLGEQNLKAKIEQVYTKEKNGKKYSVLRLDAGDFKFYSTSRALNKFHKNEFVNVLVQNLDVKFTHYLSKSFFMPAFDIDKIKSENLSTSDKIAQKIYAQHEGEKMGNFFAALFLAKPIMRELRDDIMHLGVSHLVAISGYHLGVIMSFVFFVFAPIFKAINSKFYPWRNFKFDTFVLAFFIGTMYLFLLGLVPSFLRALSMGIFGFVLLCRGIKILSFETLFMVYSICVAFFPHLLFSLGFYFSCFGVFFIYVYVLHFGDKFNYFWHGIFLNLYVFFAMQVAVTYFFPLITPTQFFVLVANYIFVIFYPLSFVLHLFGWGGIFDEILLKILEFRLPSWQFHISTWYFVCFNILALFGAKFRFIALIVPIFGVLCFI